MNWVSIKEKKPTVSGKYFVAGKYSAYADYWDVDESRFLKDRNGNGVKWWMEIPASPDGVDYKKKGMYQAKKAKRGKTAEFPYSFYQDLTDGVFTLPSDWEATVEHCWQMLDERTRTVFELVYKNGFTQGEVAEKMGVSRQRVHQIKADGMRRMKQYGTFQILTHGLKKVEKNRDDVSRMLDTGKLQEALKKLGIFNTDVNEVAAISFRGKRVLMEQGIKTLGQLSELDFPTIVSFPGCGMTTAKNISDALKQYVLMSSYNM